MSTKIAWTDESWNPATGCTPVSEGCAHCYACTFAERWRGIKGHAYEQGFDLKLHPDRLDIPLRWRKPRMVLVPSMGDLFHEDVPDEFVEDVWLTMHKASQHTFQVLTKRPERMRRVLTEGPMTYFGRDPLPNVWLGVSVENQARADERIPLLLETPAAVRFVSAEPLLGPLDELYPWLGTVGEPSLDWVIVGGESGPGARLLVERCDWNCALYERQHRPRGNCINRRHPKPEALGWVRSIRDQCQAARVSFFFKQWGPKAGQGTLVDGREHKEKPR